MTEAKNPGCAVYCAYISGLDFIADAADRCFSAACYDGILAGDELGGVMRSF